MSQCTLTVLTELRGKAQMETGRKQEKIELAQNTTLLDLLDVLQTRLRWPFKEKFIDPTTGDLPKNVIILVNGLPIRGKLKSTLLKNGDKVILFPHTACG